jgi:hypothetical protein
MDESHRRFELRFLAYRRLALYRNSAENRLSCHLSMNPQLFGDPSNRSTTMLVLTSDPLRRHVGSPVHPGPPLGRMSPKQSPRYMAFSKVGPNQSIDGAKSEYRNNELVTRSVQSRYSSVLGARLRAAH